MGGGRNWGKENRGRKRVNKNLHVIRRKNHLTISLWQSGDAVWEQFTCQHPSELGKVRKRMPSVWRQICDWGGGRKSRGGREKGELLMRTVLHSLVALVCLGAFCGCLAVILWLALRLWLETGDVHTTISRKRRENNISDVKIQAISSL